MQDFFTFPDHSSAVLAVDLSHGNIISLGKLLDAAQHTMNDNFPDPPKPPKLADHGLTATALQLSTMFASTAKVNDPVPSPMDYNFPDPPKPPKLANILFEFAPTLEIIEPPSTNATGDNYPDPPKPK